MTETTTSAAPPKKRILFKRPAVQAAAKNEEADIFSHSNEFSDIVALEEKRRAEAKKQAEASRDRKRRRISNDNEESLPPKSGSDKKAQASRNSSKARSRTPLSPAPAQSPPASLAARYDSLAKSASLSISLPNKDSHVISVSDSDDDDDDDDDHVSKPLFDGSAFDRKPFKADFTQDIAVRPSISAPVLIDDDDDDEPEEDLGPEHAALQARIRARLADRKSGKPSTAPITELLITSDIPDTIPLRVKVRIDTLIEKPRKAWCGKQNFPPKFADDVFFTWNLTRIYDSTSVARLGIKVDDNGNITMEGDSSIYDDVNLPKVHVEAWTDELFRERKKEDAAAAAAKKLASEPPVEVEQRTPTPEPVPEPTKLRLVLKAKGMPECKLTVNLTTTVAHLTSAFRSRLKIDKSQPITLISQGERLSPLDTVEDCEFVDKELVDVYLK